MRIDMTPMVDVAFLLLIFFMVTTVFMTPQALEINLPPDNKTPMQVAESKILQLRVLGEDRVYWKRGPKTDPWVRTTVAGMKDVLKPLANNDAIVILLNIDRDATFDNMVSIIDQLDLANLGRFSILELTPADKAEVENL
ncbi:MAG: biopolymer transporter ExbD [Candidatus Eisenbacteria bacterium]|uniref:Biopolymer transporter ExbD n=1 Tax=Eiseniibacteriota bacterium TaxID=2212470 RepID=A0A933SAH3_UNCEI|nr:biopolymer transporter ExbD [Candidatus Eisenbacteria bacterium]